MSSYVLGPEALAQVQAVVRDFFLNASPQDFNGMERVGRNPLRVAIGVADAAIAARTSGTVSVYRGTPQVPRSYTLVDSGQNIEAFSRYGAVNAGAEVACVWFPHGWEIWQTTCGT
jgi:hypothetical protein